LFNLAGHAGQGSTCTFRHGVKLPPKHQRVSIVPPTVGQLTIENHSNGLTNAIMLAMPRHLQCQYAQHSGLDPRMCASNPGPPLQQRIMRWRIFSSSAKVVTGGFKKKMDRSLLRSLTGGRILPHKNG